MSPNSISDDGEFSHSSPVLRRMGWLCWVVGLALGRLLGSQGPILTLDDLCLRADCVVHGRVDGLSTSTDSRGDVYTRVTLAVTNIWKGAGTNRMRIVHPGGTLGDRRIMTLGQPEYSLGEEVVLFLVTNRMGNMVTVEMGQGRFLVRRDERGTRWVSNGWLGGPATLEKSYRLPTQVPLSLEQIRRRIEAGN